MTELDMNGSHAAQHSSQQAASLHRGGWEGAPVPAQVVTPLLLPRTAPPAPLPFATPVSRSRAFSTLRAGSLQD